MAEQAKVDVIYGLNDRPPAGEAAVAALQHLLAIFVGIITPTLVLAGPMGLDTTTTSYLVSMALMVSGVATFIQVKKIGPIGSGLLSIQGTSFAFIGPMIAAGLAVGGGEAGLAMIFGLVLAGAPVEMILSRFIHLAKNIITPVVTGTVVMLIGLSLIRVGMTDIAGGVGAEDFGSLRNVALGGLVIAVVVLLNLSKNKFIRMGSIVIALAVGYIVAAFMGMVDLGGLGDLPKVSVPVPFKFGLDFDLALFIPFALLYLITTIESTGDLTATSLVSGEPIEGDVYIERIKGGVLGDGVNSAIAGTFNTFPNTTFSQNNGVIQLTGVASRYVGLFIAGFLALLGLFPIVGGLINAMPRPVLGGVTLIMFGTVAAAGIKIISTGDVGRREMLILAVSLGLGLGVQFVPDVLVAMPETVQTIFSSPITTGGLTALVMNIVIPRDTGVVPVDPI
ncbi:MAG: nucleobase:cation symporter-2 family protein [Actinomycetota bacterium]|nr:nucleobase:cation symporter-2 family protein [Actinomycetota bacterium]